jgi:cysteine dioxygenase
MELGTYTYFDNAVPYTRNLITTDNKNYTLLLLCWGAGRESKIHDHPCQGCFVRTIQGSIAESIYTVNAEKEIRYSRCNTYPEGQTSFMSDTIGLHKIGNPDPQQGAITLHLYLPPYETCKVRT